MKAVIMYHRGSYFTASTKVECFHNTCLWHTVRQVGTNTTRLLTQPQALYGKIVEDASARESREPRREHLMRTSREPVGGK